MAAQPAKTNAAMKAWITVSLTGVVSQGGERILTVSSLDEKNDIVGNDSLLQAECLGEFM